LIQKGNLLPILFSSKYDAAQKKWRSPQSEPSLEDGVEKFKRISSITEDKDTGLLTVTVDWNDRFLATAWVQELIALANQNLRSTAIAETQKNITYLRGQLRQVQLESLRQAIGNLLEDNLNRAMSANAREDYAFKIIDSPIVPDADKQIYPIRKLELIAGFIVGALFAIIFILWYGHRPVVPKGLWLSWIHRALNARPSYEG
jgi:uncharacterized protein involved in exopolysaccharide biosynthesis